MAWLERSQVESILGAALSSDLDTAALEQAVLAARGYVESRRQDLVTNGTFTPTPSVLFGAAMLAYRWYDGRGRKADEILAEDPELSRQLGIGAYGRFVFGAPEDDES